MIHTTTHQKQLLQQPKRLRKASSYTMSTYNSASSEDSFAFIYEPTNYTNLTPSPNTQSINPEWYENKSSNSTDLHSISSEEEDPLGPFNSPAHGTFTQALSGYYNAAPQVIEPQYIPQDFEKHVLNYQGYNPIIKNKGDLELDLYRNYHGEDFYWNDARLYIKNVIINDQEGSIKLYLDQDFKWLLKATSDTQWCKNCKCDHSQSNDVNINVQQPLATSAPPTPVYPKKPVFNPNIYSIQDCLDLAKANPSAMKVVYNDQYKVPALPDHVDPESIPVRPPNHLIHSNRQEFFEFVNDPESSWKLKYYAWSFENTDPIHDYLVSLAWHYEQPWPAKKSQED
ncbi:hypothetical protein FRB90_006579 [Tulasnella sp. 427]|nr:hypothetical protein FRB90_006579 [Tulasnella sp. 427]